MKIEENIKISDLTTFRTGGNARFFCNISSEKDTIDILSFIKKDNLSYFIIGNGSNLLFSDKDFDGLLVKISIGGIKIDFKNQDFSIVSVGAGEIFDDLISFSIKNDLSGIENLWNIPGTVGASVVQNIGAYGTEAKDFIDSVEGIDLNTSERFLLKNENCDFGYRESIFKNNKNLLITKVFFKLNNRFVPNLKYSGLKDRISNVKKITAEKTREIIGEIRKEKLPDWRVLGTAGSFFKNPIISIDKYQKIKTNYPDLPIFPSGDGFLKISLGYVLDKICSLKGYKIDNVGFYEKQALVIVNYGNAKAEEIISLSKLAEKKVFEKIGVKIEREIELVGF